MAQGDDRLWVFGYGSLIWDPGFDHEERVIARLSGWRRSFCMWSIHHRGTPEAPGLVLALDPAEGAACEGVALAVPGAARQAVLDYLRARELITSAYREITHPVRLADGRHLEAVTYVVDTSHPQYCGGLTEDEQARIILGAHGGRGPNAEYLFNTARHLAEMGIEDPDLSRLAARVHALRATGAHRPGDTS